jgi:hypothetical protein
MVRSRRNTAALVSTVLVVALSAGAAGTATAAPGSYGAKKPSAHGGSAFIGGICGFWGPRYIIPGC